jgi:Zn-dependent peptidase ImmA (M78 family)
MSTINYKMLSLARESRGLTQNQLVGMVANLNQGNYSKMEKGLLNITDDTLLNIAKQLDYKPSFFYKKENRHPISSFYYRKRLSMGKKELALLESKLDIFRIMIDELLDSVDIPEFKIPKYEVTNELSPSDIAIRIREFLKIPKGPIANIIDKIESAGIIVYFIRVVTGKFDGITLFTDKGQPIIFINDNLPNDRKIFTIAHELFHLISHIPFTPLPQDRDPEKEANEFAGEFLMPYLDCRNDLMDLRYSQLGVLKSYWKVSKAAIIYRAKNIFAINSDRFTNLNIELSRNGERKKENGFVEISEPQLVNLIIKSHETDMDYSLNEMIGLLGLCEKDYFEYFNRSQFRVLVTPKRVIDLSSYAKNNEKRAL